MQQGLKIGEKDRLKGKPVGFQGPWGTTYPANLGRVIKSMKAAQWLNHARQDRMPPMPACAPQQRREEDLKASYA